MIVELMGGSIQLESEKTEGSRFTIRLKLKVGKPETDSASSQEQLKRTVSIISHSNSIGRKNSKMRKLLVMSDAYSVRLLKGYVEPLDFTVKQVH